MLEKNKPSLLLTLGAAGLLIGGGAATYLVLTQRNRLLDMPVGANIIPQDALLSVSLSTDSGQWQRLREFGTPQTQAELDKNLVELRDRFLTANGYSYEEDIQPWVGNEVTIAFLSSQKPTTNSTPNPSSKTESVVVVLPIANQLAAKQILEKPKPLKQGQWINRNYKGLEIRETQSTASQISTTVLDQRFLVVADNPRSTERAIDAYKEGASLAKTVGYTQALGKIAVSQPFAQMYVNVPAAATVATANPWRPSPQGLAQLQQNQGLATTMTVEPEGVQFKSISWLKPNSQRTYVVENKTSGMQSRLPAQTLMMISGGNLQRLWQDYALSSQSNPLTPVPPENLRAGVKSVTGLDLDQDLLNWMSGEFSLSIIPATPKANIPQDFALSLVFMVQTNDRSNAEKSLKQLDQVMSSKYQFQLQEAQVGEQNVVNWVGPYGTLTATHGWLDNNVVFLTLGAPIAETIITRSVKALDSTEQFQKTVPSQLNPNNGLFFLDVEPTVKALPLLQFFPGQQKLVQAIRSIGVTTAVSDERSIRYDMFVSLKKAEKPSPLASPEIPTPSSTP